MRHFLNKRLPLCIILPFITASCEHSTDELTLKEEFLGSWLVSNEQSAIHMILETNRSLTFELIQQDIDSNECYRQSEQPFEVINETTISYSQLVTVSHSHIITQLTGAEYDDDSYPVTLIIEIEYQLNEDELSFKQVTYYVDDDTYIGNTDASATVFVRSVLTREDFFPLC